MIGLVLAVPFLLAGCLLVVGFLIRWHSYREYLRRRTELILVSQRYQVDLARAMRIAETRDACEEILRNIAESKPRKRPQLLTHEECEARLDEALKKRPPVGLIPLTDKEERELVARHMRGTRWPH